MSEPDVIPSEQLNRIARFGRLYLLPETTSTNEFAFSLLRPTMTKPDSGTLVSTTAGPEVQPAVVVARCQTKGRGRFQRHWHSDEDSLTFSVLVSFRGAAEESAPRPEHRFHPAQVTQFSGLALCQAIEEITDLKPLIRWPNDIVHQGRKLAGILCEARKSAVAVGVGVNVNQTQFPVSIPEAGSLRQATGRSVDRLLLLERFLEHFFESLARAQAGEVETLMSGIKARSALLNQRVEVRTLLRRRTGTVVDIDPEGRLVLRTASGRLVVLDSGQARAVR